MKWKTMISVVLIIMAISLMFTHRATAQPEKPGKEKFVMIWSSADRDVAVNMVLLYTYNSKRAKWWDDITLVVWGPSANLLAEDKTLQVLVKNIINAGVVVKACKLCSDSYGVSEKLEELGIIVKYMKELTDYIKEGRHILTF